MTFPCDMGWLRNLQLTTSLNNKLNWCSFRYRLGFFSLPHHTLRQSQPQVKKLLFRKMPLKVCFPPVVFANSPTRPAEHSECTRNCLTRKSSVSVRDRKRQQYTAIYIIQLPPNIIVRNASFFQKTVKAFENTIEKSIGYLIVNYVP